MKVKFTQKQRMMEGLTVFTLVVILIYVLFMYNKLPELIPSSFGINGEISTMSSKTSLFVKLAICLAIYFIFSFIMINPSTWGISYIKNNKKRELAYLISGNMFSFLKLILISIMAYIIFCSLNNLTLGKLFIPLACFVPLGVGFTTSSKIKSLKD